MKLYQQLNEQRTQGEWVDVLNPISAEYEVVCSHCDIAVFNGINSSVDCTNAQYTALAVNNLHHLAEALKPLANLDLTGVDSNIVYQRNKTFITVADIEAAQQALSRIS